MGLLTETNAQYYAGQQAFTTAGGAGQAFTCTFDTELVDSPVANYSITNNGVTIAPANYSVVNNTITITSALVAGNIVVQLSTPAMWANNGGYSYIKMEDVINNFLVAYVGEGKLISKAKRTDVMFHAKRGLQEFSYDTLKSIKSQELNIPPSLSVIIPQDYVNYVECSWIDDSGVKHIIYPTTLTSNPYTVPIQDADGVPIQDGDGANIESAQSITNTRWDSVNSVTLTGSVTNNWNANIYGWNWGKANLGRRYGLDPSTSQVNGWFTIDEREGKFSFSSDLKDKLIILEYISDGLSVDYDMRIPKMAEQAIYMHIAYSILSSKMGIPEYIVQRYKKDRRAALRNAKIRLSNIKLDEFVQVMRNKSKWIKH